MLRVLANREQNKANFLKIVDSATGCCGSDATECQYTYTDSSLSEISSITIGGEEFKLADGTPEGQAIWTTYDAMGSGADKIKYTRQVVLPYLFKSAGLVSDGISVSISGTTVVIESEVAITLNAKDADTVNCVRVAFCDYCTTWEGGQASFDVVVDGTSDTISEAVAGDFDYPGNAANIQTALSSALTDAEEIVVIDDTVNSAYRIVLTYPHGTTITLDGASVPCCNVEQGWTSA